MNLIICLAAGYLAGCINPAYLISKFKKVDLRKRGTGNLGTTNTFLNFGRGWGFFVMAFDMLKAFLAVRVCFYFFPDGTLCAVTAGAAAVLGHMFPFYTGFKGGKGVASFGGMVLALDIRCFLFLAGAGFIVALIVNRGCGLSFFAAVLFPFLYAAETKSILVFAVMGCVSLCMMVKHMDNIKKIRSGEELPLRTFLLNYIYKKRGTTYE